MIWNLEAIAALPLTFTSRQRKLTHVSSCFRHQRAAFVSSPSRYRHEKEGRQRIYFVIVNENNTGMEEEKSYFSEDVSTPTLRDRECYFKKLTPDHHMYRKFSNKS